MGETLQLNETCFENFLLSNYSMNHCSPTHTHTHIFFVVVVFLNFYFAYANNLLSAMFVFVLVFREQILVLAELLA